MGPLGALGFADRPLVVGNVAAQPRAAEGVSPRSWQPC